jgi:hypothetical protein
VSEPKRPIAKTPKEPKDEKPVLPTTSRDDTDEGWGESSRGNDDRLRDDRPPHWGSD